MKLANLVRSSFVLLPLLLAACGGGGGSDAPGAITYSGATTQATVTTTNARALSADAVTGGQAGAAFGAVGVAAESTGGVSAARLQALATLLGGAVERLAPADAGKGGTAVGAVAQNTINGAGGGSVSYTITLNESTGAFSGTMFFAAYRDQPNGPAVFGNVSFSGVYNPATQSFVTFTISFPAITMTEGSVIIGMGGSVATDKTANRVVVSLVLRDNATNKTFWVKDFTYTMTNTGLTITGTYYDPVHGYVTISTLTPLTASAFDATPTAGQLLFIGASGTRARLTFTATSHIVEVDTGSGTFATVP